MKHEKRIQQIAVYYGAWHQVEKSAEELNEAADACRQYMERPDVERFEHLAEEFADAQIMIDQLRILFPHLVPMMTKWRNKKLARQMKRIAEEKEARRR